MAGSSKITIETTDGEIVISQISRAFTPMIMLRKFEYVETTKDEPETYHDGTPNPRGGLPMKERMCVQEIPHRLSPESVKELVKALQYYV